VQLVHDPRQLTRCFENEFKLQFHPEHLAHCNCLHTWHSYDTQACHCIASIMLDGSIFCWAVGLLSELLQNPAALLV
jgi:hypothetical protein